MWMDKVLHLAWEARRLAGAREPQVPSATHDARQWPKLDQLADEENAPRTWVGCHRKGEWRPIVTRGHNIPVAQTCRAPPPPPTFFTTLDVWEGVYKCCSQPDRFFKL